jgi:hypothetical protein
MFVLILADVALCAALVMVAAFVMVMRRRRRSGAQPPGPGRQRHGAVAGPADGGMAQRGTAVVPGFSPDIVEPDFGAHAPAAPEQAAESQISGVADPQPGPHRPAAKPDRQRAPATEPDGQRAPATEPDGQRAPAAEPDGQRASPAEPDGQRAPATEPYGQAAAGAITSSERIGSYYEAADRPIADYLAAHGWTEEPGTHDPG